MPIGGRFLPKQFFVVTGHAEHEESALNAFDKALMEGGIAQCNLIPISSIIPSEAEEVEPVEIAPGTITFLVLVHQEGSSGDLIGAGVGWAWCQRKDGTGRFGIVAEEHGHKSEKYLENELMRKLDRMAEIRGLVVEEAYTKVDTMEVSENMFGSCIAAVVYVPWD